MTTSIMQRRRKRIKKFKGVTRCAQIIEPKIVPANEAPTNITLEIENSVPQPIDDWHTPAPSQDDNSSEQSFTNSTFDPCLRINFIKYSTQNIANEINTLPCQVSADIMKMMVRLLHEAYLIAGLTDEPPYYETN